ncbi:hypothetical protein K437DRAFT_268624 [Tilletiaria anomala UBC 951]|uniref:S-adenosyl-L-methionine-dependent methyltransferase n=1 Tax=Tilletiaria anomala (strain ATCC 24038 / CBS 436.72 / UBC 951) TaxID=1037660 RepID=A0A066W2A8_TILAU|nr:uncharacterized protein K437DRAFT_268624 [Tilletiaria anomala UBC 951]KDN44895.1 hypothetical protein K437DRAFT_268624 [Tilletiaria anomala UBC 951]
MSYISPDLHPEPARRATVLQRVKSATVEPSFFALLIIILGVPFAILAQLRGLFGLLTTPARVFNPIAWLHIVLFELLNPTHWRDLALQAAFPSILKISDSTWAYVKKPLLEQADGIVLEVGPGDGQSIKYYDSKKIKHLYLLEPFEALHAPLKAALHAASSGAGAEKGASNKGHKASPSECLESKATILSAGVQDLDILAKNGIREESIDTVVLVQVLCSIPDPKEHIKVILSYIKPGGKLIMFEHVRSAHPLTRAIQAAWTPLWRFMAKGCEMTRPSGAWVSEIGGAQWERQSHEGPLLRPTVEHDGELLPHDVAVFVKAKRQ